MQVQLSTDNHIEGTAELARHVESVVKDSVRRFGDQVTRVEVHLADENSKVKGGGNDKRCTMEARLAGLQPLSVTHHGASIDQVIDGAADKLEKILHRTIGRLGDAKGRVPFSGDGQTLTAEGADAGDEELVDDQT